MPYIEPKARRELDVALQDALVAIDPMLPGELNYMITKMVQEYWRLRPRYSTIATLTGVLENVKQEFYRRVAAPYEDEKLKANGDVYA